MPETYRFEELDGETKEYLLLVRDKKGKGMPGIFCGTSNNKPIFAFIIGFVILIMTVFITFPPTEHPTKEAFLQTAGFLFGGWLIVAAIRIWSAGKSGGYAGHFTYCDSETLYQASGGKVEVTDLYDIREAKAVQNFNEGAYQNTEVTVKVGKERSKFQVKDEERGRRMTVFLNAVAYMRDGGENGTDEELKKLSPESMGAVAKEVARTGEFPSNLKSVEDGEVRVPTPKREGRPSTGLFGVLAWGIIGMVLFFAFKTINKPFRDEAIFARVQQLQPKDKVPGLRLYLANPEFTAHRDEAQRELTSLYENSANTRVNGTNEPVRDALRVLVVSLADRSPAVSLIVGEEDGNVPAPPIGSAAGREEAVRKLLADRLGATIGDELVVFATPTNDETKAIDKSIKGMIDVRWKFAGPNQIQYTLEIRKNINEDPIVSKSFQVNVPGDPNQFAETVGTNVLSATIGTPIPRPIVLPDF